MANRVTMFDRFWKLMHWPGPLGLTFAMATAEAWFHKGPMALFFFCVALGFMFGNAGPER